MISNIVSFEMLACVVAAGCSQLIAHVLMQPGHTIVNRSIDRMTRYGVGAGICALWYAIGWYWHPVGEPPISLTLMLMVSGAATALAYAIWPDTVRITPSGKTAAELIDEELRVQ